MHTYRLVLYLVLSCFSFVHAGSMSSDDSEVRVFAGTTDLTFVDVAFIPPSTPADVVPESTFDDFSQLATELGDALQRYPNEFLAKASEFSEFARDKIVELKSTVNAMIEISKLFSHIPVEHGVDSKEFSEKLSAEVALISDELQRENPSFEFENNVQVRFQDDDRVAMITHMLAKLESRFISLSTLAGIPQEQSQEHFGELVPHLRRLMNIVGDLIKAHPIIFDTIVISVVMMMIPESLILGPVLRLFGFGIRGPVAGSIAAWAQRFFYGAAVKEGSWFAIIQSMGMILKVSGWIRAAMIAVWVAVVTATQGWFGSAS